MGRKNSFDPNSLKNNNTYKSIVHKNVIEWINDVNKNNINFKIDNLLINSNLQLDNLKKSTIFVEENIKSGSSDLDKFKDFKIIGIVELCTNIQLNIDNEIKRYMYIITDKEYKNLFISIGICDPIFWYKFTNKKTFIDSFDLIYSIYNPNKYDVDYPKNVRAFIGTEKMLETNIGDIESHFLLNDYSECLLWGSQWQDYPFRNIYMERVVSGKENIIMSNQAIKQTPNTHYISVRTMFSKSIITVEDNNGAFIINIKYNPLNSKHIININNTLEREYQSDIPIDVIMSIINFPFVTHTGLLKLKPLTSYNFIIASLVVNNNKMYKEIILITEKIIPEIENVDTKETAVVFLKNMKNNSVFEEIMNDKTIEKFINDRIDDFKNGSKTENVIKNDILKEVDKKLKQLEHNDVNFKKYFTGIINGILTQ